MNQQFARDDVKSIQLAGGLSTAGMALARKPGTLDLSINYEPALGGGYRRTKGYERFNGMRRPSSITSVRLVDVSLAAAVDPGTEVLVGGVSAIYIGQVDGGRTLLANAPYEIANGAPIMRGQAAVGVVTNADLGPARTIAEEAVLVGQAQDVLRASIGPVPGEGPVRGVAVFKDKVYAWRDDIAGAGTRRMFEAQASGWSEVKVLFEEVRFKNASGALIAGIVLKNTVSQSDTGRGTVRRVIIDSGSLASGTNTGTLLLEAGGSLHQGSAAAEAAGGTAKLEILSAPRTPAIPGGASPCRCIKHNFSGAEGGDRLYIATGTGRPREFDGTDSVPITLEWDSMIPPDILLGNKAEFICAHASRLIVSVGASLMWSTAASPFSFDGITGAQEFALGDSITGFASLPGKSLGITTANKILLLSGTPSSTMELQTLSSEYGAMAGGALATTDLFSISGSGFLSLKATDRFGDFEANNASDSFAAEARKLSEVFSCACRVDLKGSENQLRYMGSDGTGMVLLIQGGAIAAATGLKYPIAPSVMTSGRIKGTERVFIGAEDGFVYEVTGASASFDGQEIEAVMRTNALTLGSPMTDKTFREAVVDIASDGFSNVSVFGEMNGGSPLLASTLTQGISAGSGGGSFDVGSWDTFYWDQSALSSPSARLGGTGRCISITFYSKSRYDVGHTLQALSVRYSARKTTRTT